MSPPLSTPKTIAVVGPTATGKTRVGAGIARYLGSEVISVDSQLVYAGLVIGTACPTPEEIQGVPHHMIGVVPPTAVFSAGDYRELAMPILSSLWQAGKHPVLVGGTGFYLRALMQPEHLPQVPVDPAVRQVLKTRLAEEGADALYETLKRQDPVRAAQLHPHDTKRVIRALEIIAVTGQPVAPTPSDPAFDLLPVGLTYANRQQHVAAIRRRLEAMVAAGFVDEVAALYEQYGNCHALQNAHGYPEFLDVVLGHRTLEEALDQVEINIRQYSKRQMTWFRKLPGIRWYMVDTMSLDEVVKDVVEQIR